MDSEQPPAAHTELALEFAESEFKRFVDEWDIDDNMEAMSGEDRESFEQVQRRVIIQIQKRNATVDEEGTITYTLKHPKGSTTEIVFKVPGGDAYMAMDKFKERQSMHKLNAFMGVMTKLPAPLFSNMDGRDIKFCQAVTTLFLGS